MVMNIMALDQGRSACFTKEAILGGSIGIFGFAVLAIFYTRSSVLVPENFGFSVLVLIVVCGYSVS